MNYIDKAYNELGTRIKVGKGLMFVYTLLVLVKGEETTLEDVHDAWALNINTSWDKAKYGEHFSMVPFDELKEETKAKDQKYVDAIRETARAIKEK